MTLILRIKPEAPQRDPSGAGISTDVFEATAEGRRRVRWLGRMAVAAMMIGGLVGRLEALTVAELLDDPQLTPNHFANHFEQFQFEFQRAVQSPESFLSRQAGDCDDY